MTIVERSGAASVAVVVPPEHQGVHPSVWRRTPGSTPDAPVPEGGSAPMHWSPPFVDGDVKLGTVHVFGQPAAMQPRHRHTFEQIRFMISGSMEYGRNKVAEAGDCVYFPESVPYGPNAHDSGCMLILQWQGPSPRGKYFDLIKEGRPAAAELVAGGGEFDLSKGGVFRHPDGRVQDGYEAVAERLNGGPLAYAPPRLDRQIRLRAAQFPAVELDGCPGVRIKHLGFLNAAGPNIKIVELDAGASIPAAVARSQQVWDVIGGSITYEGAHYPSLSLLYTPFGGARGVVTADAPAEILAVHLQPPRRPLMPFSEY